MGDISHVELAQSPPQKLATGSLPANHCFLQFPPTHSGGPTVGTEPHLSFQGLTVSTHLFLLHSTVLIPEKKTKKTEPSFLGVPSYSFPCGWILACSFAGVPFYPFSPSQGDQQSEPKESIGTLASLGTRDIKKTTLKGRHWLVSGKQLSVLETSGHWMSCR